MYMIIWRKKALELSLNHALNRFDQKAEDNSKLPLDNSAHLRGLQCQSTEIEFIKTYKSRCDLISRRCD